MPGRTNRAEFPRKPAYFDLRGAEVGVGRDAIRQHRARHRVENRAHMRIVDAQHRNTIERQAMHELDKGVRQAREVAAVRSQVIAVDVRDHRDHRLQMQERCIAFVGFGDQVTARAQLCIAAGAVEQPADDERRIEIRFLEYRRDEAGGRRLAVRSRDGDAVAIAHQLAEHFRTCDHRNTCRMRSYEFRIRCRNRARYDDHIGAGNVFRAVADRHAGTELHQPIDGCRTRNVGTGDSISLVQQHFGDPAHAGAADPNEMDLAHAAHLRHLDDHLT